MIRCLVIVVSLLTGTLIYAFFSSGWVRNYLPDLLWAFAICQTAKLMFDNKFHPGFVYALLILPFVTEVGQFPGLLSGTFDMADLLIYAGLYTIFFHSQTIALCKRAFRALSSA